MTGATGFIGRELLAQLQQAGHPVRALSRHGGVDHAGGPVLALDLAEEAVDPALLADTDVVYHLAGIAHQRARPEDYQRVNVEATLALAHQAAAAGVPLFVFLSSVKAHQADALPGDPYAESKYRVECALLEEFAGAGMAVVILRPALVYGAGVKGNLAALAVAVARGMPRPPQVGGRSMIGVADLARLLIQIGERWPCAPSGTVWTATDGEAYSTQRLFDALRRAGGHEPGRAWVPLWCWRILAGLLDLLTLSRPGGRYERLFGTEIKDGSAVCQALDWYPGEVFEDLAPLIAAGSGRGEGSAA